MFFFKTSLKIFLIIFIFCSFSQNCHAIRLLTQDQAVKNLFPDVDKVNIQSKTLSADEISTIKSKLGGNLFHYTESSTKEKINKDNTYTFIYGIKNNKTARIAIIDEQPGKWGPVEFIIVIDTITGKINNLAVMSYVEKRGRPIARNNFLKQFINKGITDKIAIQKDIHAISGATVSSDCTCFAVKKAIVIYETVFKGKV
jgi:Na+-translocating ferredoxin:NAD+ oxidoreductase RnfG subunit